MKRVYSIYHVKDERFCKEFDESKYNYPKDYNFIAQLHVESESIEDGLDIVFEKANSIDQRMKKLCMSQVIVLVIVVCQLVM